MAKIAFHTQYGYGVPQTAPTAEPQERMSIPAARRAVWMSLNGVGGPRDPQYAVELLDQLVRLGDPWAMTQLGGCYRRGDGVSWDEAHAMKLYLLAARASNDAEAESEIGRGFLNGFGPDTTNYPAAFAWLSKATRQGYPPAQLQLGYMYQRGWGVALNRGIAGSLYEAASRSRDPEVQKAAADLQQSLQHDKSESDDKVMLGILGGIAVAVLASSSSSSPSNSNDSGRASSAGIPQSYSTPERIKTCVLKEKIWHEGSAPNWKGYYTESSHMGYDYQCP